MPWSAMAIAAASFLRSTRTSIGPPSGLSLTAFCSKVCRTCSRRRSAPNTVNGSRAPASVHVCREPSCAASPLPAASTAAAQPASAPARRYPPAGAPGFSGRTRCASGRAARQSAAKAARSAPRSPGAPAARARSPSAPAACRRCRTWPAYRVRRRKLDEGGGPRRCRERRGPLSAVGHRRPAAPRIPRSSAVPPPPSPRAAKQSGHDDERPATQAHPFTDADARVNSRRCLPSRWTIRSRPPRPVWIGPVTRSIIVPCRTMVQP